MSHTLADAPFMSKTLFFPPCSMCKGQKTLSFCLLHCREYDFSPHSIMTSQCDIVSVHEIIKIPMKQTTFLLLLVIELFRYFFSVGPFVMTLSAWTFSEDRGTVNVLDQNLQLWNWIVGGRRGLYSVYNSSLISSNRF